MAVALLCAAVPAPADSGEGAYPRQRGDAVWAFGPLERLGDSAVRFSSAPALGGRGVVVELAGQPDGTAKGDVTFVHGHPFRGWKRGEPLPLVLGAQPWTSLRAAMEQTLARPEPSPGDGDDLVICTDGPGYVTEWRSDGRSRWLSGFCGDHPNRKIANLFNDLLRNNFANF